ncbi:prepilin-type N-terminal cleavage/methylation domain-containing protein [Parelusimicrobium proximum]|uniref:type IV pilin protein n=1 Tax=Parelusimicrobium proximum TaxID=3228953 RepID=UPI003D17807D
MENKNGFTLIELLVVVLIIAILAAVALPQYTKSVEKARASEAMLQVRALYDAGERYRLANDEWVKRFAELDVSIPNTAECTSALKGQNTTGTTDCIYNNKFVYRLYSDGSVQVSRGTERDLIILYRTSQGLRCAVAKTSSKKNLYEGTCKALTGASAPTASSSSHDEYQFN